MNKEIIKAFITTFLGTLFGLVTSFKYPDSFFLTSIVSSLGSIMGVILSNFLFKQKRNQEVPIKYNRNLLGKKQSDKYLILLLSTTLAVIAIITLQKPLIPNIDFVDFKDYLKFKSIGINFCIIGTLTCCVTGIIGDVKYYNLNKSFSDIIGTCIMFIIGSPLILFFLMIAVVITAILAFILFSLINFIISSDFIFNYSFFNSTIYVSIFLSIGTYFMYMINKIFYEMPEG
jgi:hypothetical protein